MRKSLCLAFILASLLLTIPLTSASIFDWLGITGKAGTDVIAACIDSDGAKNEYVIGEVKGLEAPEIWDTWKDYCGVSGEEQGKLVEYYCDNNYGKKYLYNCPYGCQNGACIGWTLTCVDDDGLDYFNKGSVKGMLSNNESWGGQDRCEPTNSKILYESYCQGNSAGVKYYECPNGCQDGVCIKESQEPVCGDGVCGDTEKEGCPDDCVGAHAWAGGALQCRVYLNQLAGADYLKMLLITDDVTRKYITLHLWDDANGVRGSEIASASQIELMPATHQEWGDWGWSNTYEGTPLYYGWHRGKISIATPLIGYYWIGVTQSQAGLNALNTGITNDKDSNTFAADEYGYDYKDKNWDCIYKLETGGTAEKCTDSDGGKNYNMKGTTKGIWSASGKYEERIDACDSNLYNGRGLSENYCYNNSVWSMTYDCTNGCKDGACLKSPATCTDSDGGIDYNVKGKIIAPSVSYLLEDKCDGNLLIENFCPEIKEEVKEYNCNDISDYCYTKYKCPVNCSNGACIGEECIVDSDCGDIQKCGMTWKCDAGTCLQLSVECPLNKCTDTDKGVDYYVKGTVVYPDGGSNTDLCIEKNGDGSWGDTSYSAPYLLEYSCPSNENYGKDLYECENGCEDGACIIKKDDKICKPKWQCIMEPEICSSSGKQTKICKDISCGMEPIKEEISCSEGECSGCILADKCLPYGYRTKIEGDGFYCSINNELEIQKEEGESCDNHHECTSNLCINDECISQGLMQKILNWFKKLFGKD